MWVATSRAPTHHSSAPYLNRKFFCENSKSEKKKTRRSFIHREMKNAIHVGRGVTGADEWHDPQSMVKQYEIYK